MRCPTCFSENVILENGLYFCSECSSQQPAAREEAIDEENLNISNRNIVGSSTNNSSAAESDSDPEIQQCSWYENYNILLQKQVSALIHLGVSEKLKNVVLFIWVKYLQKCKAVFIEKNAKCQKKTNFVKETHKSVKKSKSKKRKKTNVKKTKKIDNILLSFVLPPHLKRYYNARTIKEDEHMDVDQMSSEEADISDFKSFWNSFELRFRARCVDKMCMLKTLCFCYLGLLYTQDQLLLTDFLRLVKEERIPFINVPPSIKQQFKSTMTPVVPDVCLISKKSSELIRFLELPKVDCCLIRIAIQFIKDLNLPDNIIVIVRELVGHVKTKEQINAKFQHGPYRLPLFEIRAIALIIIVLKMVYILNGEYELKHSDISRKINIVLKGRRLFVWDQWQKQTALKEYLFLKPSGERRGKISFFDSLSASQITSKYWVYPRDEPMPLSTHGKKVRQARHNIANVFSSMHSGRGHIPVTPAPTSFPLTQNLREFMVNWKTMPMYKETEEMDFSLLTEKFSSDLLFYKPSSNEDESSREIIDLMYNSLYKSVPTSETSDIYTSDCLRYLIQASSDYWRIQPTKYRFKLAWLKEFAPSFQWLLKFMSKYINTSCENVYFEVLNMEKKLWRVPKRVQLFT